MEKSLWLNDKLLGKFLGGAAEGFPEPLPLRWRLKLANLRLAVYLGIWGHLRKRDALVVYNQVRQVVWMGACVGSIRENTLKVKRSFWNPFHVDIGDVITQGVRLKRIEPWS